MATSQCTIENYGRQYSTLIWYLPHHALHNSSTLLCMFFCPSVWARKGVVHFVALTWVAFGTKWKIKFPFGGTKQLCDLQGTMIVFKTFYHWIGFHGLCNWPWISTLGNSLKSQWWWIVAILVHLPTFQPWSIIRNVHIGLDQIIHCAFVKTSHLCLELWKPLVVHIFSKVACWHLCTFVVMSCYDCNRSQFNSGDTRNLKQWTCHTQLLKWK